MRISFGISLEAAADLVALEDKEGVDSEVLVASDTHRLERGSLQSFLATRPSFSDFVAVYGDKAYEMELDGEVEVENGIVKLIQS